MAVISQLMLRYGLTSRQLVGILLMILDISALLYLLFNQQVVGVVITLIAVPVIGIVFVADKSVYNE